MPSIMYYGNGSPEWFRDYPRNPDGLIKVYMLPPVLYPDGTQNYSIYYFFDLQTHLFYYVICCPLFAHVM